ncbi:MAG: FkbM family methyltransferase [Nitrospiria bacterium]
MPANPIPRFFKKTRRELFVGLSKLGLKKASIKYRKLKVRIPLIYGIGRYHFLPPDNLWMRKAIRIATTLWPERAVVDIGANVGQFMLELKAISDSNPYYGFEPNPPCMFYLYELIRMNQFPKTFVYPVAVSERNQVHYLYSSAWDSGTSTLVEAFRQENKAYSTSVYSVNGDDFLETVQDDICFIKIDVEGFEYEVLKGIKDVVNKQRPLIFCEILVDHQDEGKLEKIKENIQSIHTLMTNIQYQTYGEKEDLEPFLMNHVGDYANFGNDFLFIPREHVKQVMNHI